MRTLPKGYSSSTLKIAHCNQRNRAPRQTDKTMSHIRSFGYDRYEVGKKKKPLFFSFVLFASSSKVTNASIPRWITTISHNHSFALYNKPMRARWGNNK